MCILVALNKTEGKEMIYGADPKNFWIKASILLLLDVHFSHGQILSLDFVFSWTDLVIGFRYWGYLFLAQNVSQG